MSGEPPAKRRKIEVLETPVKQLKAPFPPEFVELMKQEFNVENEWNPEEYFQGCTCWGFYCKGNLTGCAVSEKTSGEHDFETIIHSFAILEDCRGRGLGTEFWEELKPFLHPPVGCYIAVTKEEMQIVIREVSKALDLQVETLERLINEEKPRLKGENFFPDLQNKEPDENDPEVDTEGEDFQTENEDDYDMDDDWLVDDDLDEEQGLEATADGPDVDENLLRQQFKARILSMQTSDFEKLVTNIQNEAYRSPDVVHPNGSKKNLKFCFWNKQRFEVDPRTWGLIEGDLVQTLHLGAFR